MSDATTVAVCAEKTSIIERLKGALTMEETAARLRVKRTAVGNWVKAGKLKAVKAGGRVLIPRDELERFLEP